MTLLDFLVILVFLLVLWLAKFSMTPFAIGILVLCLVIERFLKGERL